MAPGPGRRLVDRVRRDDRRRRRRSVRRAPRPTRRGCRAPSSRPRCHPTAWSSSKGTFTLFDPDPDRVQTSHMRYEMTLVGEDGRRFRLSGHKTLRHGSASRRVERDHDARRDHHRRPAQPGRLRDHARRVARLAPPAHDDARHAHRTQASSRGGVARFAGLFTRELLTSYGGVLGEAYAFDTTGSGTSRRSLRLPAPEIVVVPGRRPVDGNRGRRLRPTRCVAAPDPVPGRHEGSGRPRARLRDVDRGLRHRHDRHQPHRVPRRARLRRLALRPPLEPRPAPRRGAASRSTTSHGSTGRPRSTRSDGGPAPTASRSSRTASARCRC